jgi:TetR/AcrR family transcriptional regulator of autoinduction and epiphytic fitness
MNVANSTKSLRARDARFARTIRTRAAIAEALNALIHEGNSAPTVAEVAARANVAVRTVFHHFGDMEGLYADVIRRNELMIASYFVALDPATSLDVRVRQLVFQQCALYERLAPLRRAMRARLDVCDSPAIRSSIRRLHLALSQHAGRTFAVELKDRADRFGSLERIAALTSYELWDHLVRVQRLSASKVRRHMVVSVLREFA